MGSSKIKELRYELRIQGFGGSRVQVRGLKDKK
jgi:hypothetical protein